MKRSASITRSVATCGHPGDYPADCMPINACIERASTTSAAALSAKALVLERLEHEAVNAESDAARVRALELLGQDSRCGPVR